MLDHDETQRHGAQSIQMLHAHVKRNPAFAIQSADERLAPVCCVATRNDCVATYITGLSQDRTTPRP
jgi:hypothetical protein